MKVLILVVFWALSFTTAKGQTFQVDTLLMNGQINKRINLVILGDGYTPSQLPQFYQDAQNLTLDIFQTSPLAEYQTYFNVFAIEVPSAESGASHPNTANDCPSPTSHPSSSVNNYFGSQFDYYGIHRLLVATNTSAITSVLANNFPMYDHVFILVNSPYYGGSGGWLATSSLHSSASEIAIHEIGHSFSSLADEYYAGDIYAAERPNMTQDTALLTNKWRNWIGDQNIDVYQHCCSGNSSQWYKPNNSCKMQYLGSPLCAVCKQTFTKKIHDLTQVIDEYSPANSSSIPMTDSIIFAVDLLYPNPNTLQIEWFLNGSLFNSNKDSLTLYTSSLNMGTNTLSVQVTDTTSFVRIDTQTTHIQSVQWQIDQTISGLDVSNQRSKKSIFLSPNPSSDYILVEFEKEEASEIQFNIRNTQGQIVKNEHVSIKVSGILQHQINIKDLFPGTYFLEVIEGEFVYSLPFIVNRY